MTSRNHPPAAAVELFVSLFLRLCLAPPSLVCLTGGFGAKFGVMDSVVWALGRDRSSLHGDANPLQLLMKMAETGEANQSDEYHTDRSGA